MLGTFRLSLAALTVAILVTAAGSGARAQSFDDYPEARIETYLVTGATPAEIFSSITTNARDALPNGGQAHAYAQSQFNWTTRSNGNRCEVDLTIELLVVFPQHVDPQGLTGDAWTWWDAYIKTLEIHEAGHLRIASETYPVLLDALQSGSCSGANERGMAILDDLAARQTRYDAITNHGATQERASN